MKNINIENGNTIKACASVIIGITAVAGCASTEVKPVKQLITQSYEEPKNEINNYIVKDNDSNNIKVTCNGFEDFKGIQARMKHVENSFDGLIRAMQVVDSGSNLPTIDEYTQITYVANGITDEKAIPAVDTLRFPYNCERVTK